MTETAGVVLEPVAAWSQDMQNLESKSLKSSLSHVYSESSFGPGFKKVILEHWDKSNSRIYCDRPEFWVF
jgi:hypothetical protein